MDVLQQKAIPWAGEGSTIYQLKHARCLLGETHAFSHSVVLQNVINEFLHECFKGLQRHTCKMTETFKSAQTRNAHNDWIFSCYDFTQAMVQTWLITVAWMFLVNYYLFKRDVDALLSLSISNAVSQMHTNGNTLVQFDMNDGCKSIMQELVRINICKCLAAYK